MSSPFLGSRHQIDITLHSVSQDPGSGVTPICSMIRSNCRTSVAASKRLKQHRCRMLKVTWKATRPTWRG